MKSVILASFAKRGAGCFRGTGPIVLGLNRCQQTQCLPLPYHPIAIVSRPRKEADNSFEALVGQELSVDQLRCEFKERRPSSVLLVFSPPAIIAISPGNDDGRQRGMPTTAKQKAVGVGASFLWFVSFVDNDDAIGEAAHDCL
jgi:hypothetical protein